MKHLIWKSEIDDAYLDALREENPSLSEDELYEMAYEGNMISLEDERTNLDIGLPSPIIVIADLGLWYDRRQGYKMIESGNIKDCLYDNNDDVEWYVDSKKDLRATSVHHDGTNYYRYRMLKESCSESQIERFKEKLYNGTATSKDITRYTKRIGDSICNVYGW